ncbi:MAG: DNA-processing protein DprA [Chloroflexi bacterium]|nr:DNA-processing protein DprA [Chloroflexota bacterium]
MISELSANTQAILLLTAPLIVGRRTPAAEALQPREYNKLAQLLHEHNREPADLLSPEASRLLNDDWLRAQIDSDRVGQLLARGFLLSQAVEQWQQRAIWVLSRADDQYPQRLKVRLGSKAPAILYGCGDRDILDSGGLAVVGSRHVDDKLRAYAAGVGELVANAEWTLVSGGARGIDQASMRGALEAGGRVVGVLSNDLQRAALRREHREVLMDGRLALISPYDPSAGFNVGNAMRRNKLVYALADAGLVASSDHKKGGTWAGAVEQLDELKLVPVYVRSGSDKALQALIDKGAYPWPDPRTPEEFWDKLDSSVPASGQPELPIETSDERMEHDAVRPESEAHDEPADLAVARGAPDEMLFAKVAELVIEMTTPTPKSLDEITTALGVSRPQATAWLKRLVGEGKLEKQLRPARYQPVTQATLLLDQPKDS